jgi:hypothetical protein
LVAFAREGHEVTFKSLEVTRLNRLYEWQDAMVATIPRKDRALRQMALF